MVRCYLHESLPLLSLFYYSIIIWDDNLHYGPGARCVIGIGPGQDYDEAEEIKPNFDRKKWKCIFIQTRSNVQKLQPDTWFLCCKLQF